MNNFFTDTFRISKINTCVLVAKKDGKLVHRGRPDHGLVIQPEGIKVYTFENGHELTITAGDVFYLPKFSNYTVKVIEEGECIAVNFELDDKTLTYKPFVLKSPRTEGISKYFNNLLNDWLLKKNGYINSAFGNLYNIIYQIQKNFDSEYIPSQTKKLVNHTALYINENISDCKLTVKEIADHFGYTPEYLRKLFKSVYKISPRQYIIEARMKKAKELIYSKEFSINEISRMCGYDNESYFSAEFKRLCGCNPTQYGKKSSIVRINDKRPKD